MRKYALGIATEIAKKRRIMPMFFTFQIGYTLLEVNGIQILKTNVHFSKNIDFKERIRSGLEPQKAVEKQICGVKELGYSSKGFNLRTSIVESKGISSPFCLGFRHPRP